MADCIDCGKELGFWEGNHLRQCSDCINKNDPAVVQQSKEQQAISSIILTTETAPNLNITKRIEICPSSYIMGHYSGLSIGGSGSFV